MWKKGQQSEWRHDHSNFYKICDSKKLAQILQVFAELDWLKNLSITISFYFLPLGASRKKILQKTTCMIFFFHTARFGLKGFFFFSQPIFETRDLLKKFFSGESRLMHALSWSCSSLVLRGWQLAHLFRKLLKNYFKNIRKKNKKNKKKTPEKLHLPL